MRATGRAAVALTFAAGLAACGGTSTGAPPTDAVTTTTTPVSLVLPSPLPTTGPTAAPPTAASSTTIAPASTSSPATVATTSPPTLVSTTAASPTAAAECVASIPLRARVAQLVWPAVYGDALRSSATSLAQLGVGGAVVMTFPAGAKTADLLALKQAGAVPLLLATDEEGGRVQRFKVLGALPAPHEVAATMTVEAARAMVADHAKTLAAAGIDIVFAPVVDVQPDGVEGPIGERSFGADPAVVTAYASAYVAGWQSAGIIPVLKHFPGHGAATGDTHDGFASTAPLDDLRRRDLLPYAELAGSGAAVMVGHLDVPDLTESGLPASISPAAIAGLLRGEYGYEDALVISDALGMDAITQRYSLPEAAELALIAGEDVVIFTNTDQAAAVIDGLVAAVDAGRLSEARVDDALSRVLRAKQIDPCAMARSVG